MPLRDVVLLEELASRFASCPIDVRKVLDLLAHRIFESHRVQFASVFNSEEHADALV